MYEQPPSPPPPPPNPWMERLKVFTDWFKANALNAGITLVIGYILGRLTH